MTMCFGRGDSVVPEVLRAPGHLLEITGRQVLLPAVAATRKLVRRIAHHPGEPGRELHRISPVISFLL